MALRSLIILLLALTGLAAEKRIDFICPMDPGVRAPSAGKCPRCGMKLVAGLPEPDEYPVTLELMPRAVRPGDNVVLRFRIEDPKTGNPVKQFELMHEKLFHLFIVSQDLQYFAHEHPEMQPDGAFKLQTAFPQPGQYRLLSDFYPQNGTPQLAASTVILPGKSLQATLAADLAPKTSENLEVDLTTEPAEPIPGKKTMLFFRLNPAEGLEPYLGAWGHMLAASSDLVDMIHSHPAFGQGGSTIQFNVIFPRPGIHRVWVQFQRLGKVNTGAFNVPVSALQ